MSYRELIDKLRSVDDSPPPEEAPRYIAMMSDLCTSAADTIEALTDIKNMSVYEKVMMVSSEIGKVQMTLNVDTGKGGSYKAISINDVVDSLIPLVNKYRLAVIPGEKEIIQQEQITTTTKYGEKQQFYVRVKASYVIVNVDKPEEWFTTCGYGDGIDSGDKATGKAITYARKYALIDAFNLSKGDDPDKDASQEYQQIQMASAEQVSQILTLYSDKEIATMLKRMKKPSLTAVTSAEADKMINKRDRSLVNDNTETF